MNPFISESQRYEYLLTPSSIVLDAGGYQGDFAQGIVERYGCRVIVLEPIEEYAKAVKLRLATNPNITVRQFAISPFDGKIAIGQSNNSSGLYSGGAKVTVPTTKLATLMEREAVEQIDLLKLNIEGAEYGVLENILKDGLMPKIKHLQVQWHHCAPRWEDRYAAIRRQLLETHEHVWGEDPSLWESYTRK